MSNNTFYNLIFTFLLVFFGGQKQAIGQSEQEIKNSFFQGKKMLEAGNFRQAKMSFENLANSGQKHDYALYSGYFYAFSLFRSADYAGSIKILQNLLNQSPNWSQADEARYLLANAFLEKNDWKAAEEQFAKIRNNTFGEDIKRMRKWYWTKANLETLTELYALNSANEVLNGILWSKLSAKLLQPAEKELFEKISKQLGKEPKQEIRKENQKKTSYQIAVLLPFKQSENDPYNFVRKAQYLFDMCEGMRIAQQDLDSLGMKVNLQLFDTEQDNNKINKILEMAQVQSADVLIALETPMLKDFARQFQTPVINPLSMQFETDQNHFLFYPSLETQARKAFVFANDSFPALESGIYYGITKRDSILAHTYKQLVEGKGGQVKFFKKIKSNSNSYNTIRANLGSLSSKAHLFVCSSESALAGNILSAMGADRRTNPIMATEEWLSFANLNYEQLDNQPIYFISPDYLDALGSEIEWFKQKYVRQTNLIPSKFGYLGYELLHFIGKNLNQTGSNLGENLKRQGFMDGRLFTGTSYYQSLDNQIVPITRLQSGSLVLVFK